MSLRQQIIEDQIDQLKDKLHLSEDETFIRFVYSLIIGTSIYSFDYNDLVDGGQDKQIDTITIDEENADEAVVYIIQVKNTSSFSSNSLIQMHNGLNWIFNRPRPEVNSLANVKFKDKINEYRSIQSARGPSNIRIKVYFVTKGLTSELSPEFKQEMRSILLDYDNGTFSEFSFQPIGADELVNLMNLYESKSKKINVDVKIKYDTNNPSLIKYYAQDLKGIVVSIPATEIAKLVNDENHDSVFDLNLRKFLGNSQVNKEIKKTCTDNNESYQFWFLNNGITIVCDFFDAVTDPDNPILKIENLQIVNGCQTATTIALAQREGILLPDVRVLTRIYQTKDPDLVKKIVLTTNNQNKITSRDLRANEVIQLDLARSFQSYGYYYERKPKEFDNKPIVPEKIAPNEIVAQSYLAIILRRPSDARRRKYKIWGEHYLSIFQGKTVEPYIFSFEIYRYTANWLQNSKIIQSSDDVLRKIARNASFHLARIASFQLRKTDNWDMKNDELKDQLQKFLDEPQVLDEILETSIEVLKKIISDDTRLVSDIDNALKSFELDESISRYLHTNLNNERQNMLPLFE